MASEGDPGPEWVVRLHPAKGRRVEDLLSAPVHMDVWSREENTLVAALTQKTIEDLERHGLAVVERISTVEEYKARAERE